MKIEVRPLTSVTPYDANPRSNDAAVAAVAESIRRFGFRQPIVVDEHGVIVVGHTRWKAAQALELAEVPVHVADLTPEQARAYRLADNKTAELATWDNALLAAELAALGELGVGLADFMDLGFNEAELAALCTPPSQGLTDPDHVPEPPDEPTTRRGDLWLLGEHRLLCGDSADEADVGRLCEAKPVQLLHTDPPYNVSVESRSNNSFVAGGTTFAPRKQDGSKRAKDGPKRGTTKQMRAKDRPLINDNVTAEEFSLLLTAWFSNAALFLEPGRAFYCWGGYANLANYPAALEANDLYFSQAIVWDKCHPVLTRKDFMGAFELAFYGWRKGAAHVYLGPNNATDLWAIKKVNPQSMIHLTEKPAELGARAMLYSSRPGERVLDLFGGSGSTLIAAEQTGRRALLMEIDPAYCDVIVARWEAFTGKKAERQATGAVA